MGKYLQIYRWTLGPKKSVEALLFLTRVGDVESPAGLDKKGTVRVPNYGSKRGATIVSAGTMYICTYSRHTATTTRT